MATSTIKMLIPPTKTLVSSSSGIAPVGDNGSNNVTFASDPKQYSLFTFKFSGQKITGYASWCDDNEIRGMIIWVTNTPNEFFGVFGIDNISGTSGRLNFLYYYNKNNNALDTSKKLVELTGIGIA